MKYLVKNKITKEETLCEKVVVDGHDYYVNNGEIEEETHYISTEGKLLLFTGRRVLGDILPKCANKIIATTNKSLNLPVVVDEVEELAMINVPPINVLGVDLERVESRKHFICGFNKAKETYQYTKDDMISIIELSEVRIISDYLGRTNPLSVSELFDIWQEQRTLMINVK